MEVATKSSGGRSPGHRLRAVVSAAGTLFAVIGLAGTPEDITTWGKWLRGVESDYVYAGLYIVLLAASLAPLTATVLRRLRDRRRDERALPPAAAAPPPALPQPKAEPAPSAYRSAVEEAPPSRPRSSEQRPAADPRLSSARLQKQLDEGVRLRRDIPAFPGVTANLVRPETTQADVDMWVKRTQRILREADAELLAEFNYKPGRSILDGLIHRSLEPPFKRTLDQRIANLKGIVEDLRHAGR